jgi:hypothetical protein
LLVEIDFIILKIKSRSHFKRKAFSVFGEVLDVHAESLGVIYLLLEPVVFLLVYQSKTGSQLNHAHRLNLRLLFPV